MMLALAIAGEQQETREKTALLQSFREPLDALGERAEANYRTSLIAYELGQAIGGQEELKGVLRSLLHILERRLHYDRGAVFLKGPDGRLAYQVGFGFKEVYIDLFSSSELKAAAADVPASAAAGAPETRSRTSPAGAETVPELFRKLGVASFACSPITAAGEVLGMLYVDRSRSDQPVSEQDVILISSMAPMVGLAIRHAELRLSQRGATADIAGVLGELRDAEAARDLAAAERDEARAERGQLAEDLSRRLNPLLGEARRHAETIARAADDAAGLIRAGAGGLQEGERLEVLQVVDVSISHAVASFRSSADRLARHSSAAGEDVFLPAHLRASDRPSDAAGDEVAP